MQDVNAMSRPLCISCYRIDLTQLLHCLDDRKFSETHRFANKVILGATTNFRPSFRPRILDAIPLGMSSIFNCRVVADAEWAMIVRMLILQSVPFLGSNFSRVNFASLIFR